MNARTLIGLTAFAIIAPSIAGCSFGASGTAPTVTVPATVTTTATANPEPTSVPQSASDSLSAFDAWLLCYGATYAVIGIPDDRSWTVQPYDETAASGDPTVTDNGDGSFRVLLTLMPTSGNGNGGEAICDASGTIGDPSVFVWFGPGLGLG